ncbi:MAG: site-2 protease family protein [Candidatus Gracilibacteria bacterium]|nr:site-2 protease family protein [Candidatus Gracilibacteria bacterium]
MILVHEWGHFASARKFGVKVEEFGLGIPPRAKKLFTDKKGTLFSLNRLPLGGFVRLYGENPQLLQDKNSKEALFNKPAWQQSIIILAGVFMNFVLAIFIFSLLFFFGVKPVGVNTVIPTEVESKLIPTYEQALESGILIKGEGVALYPIEDSIAKNAGINEGDILTHVIVNNEQLTINSPNEVIDLVGKHAGEEIELILNTSSQPSPLEEKEQEQSSSPSPNKGEGLGVRSVKVTPSSDGKIGAYLGDNIKINENFEYNYSIFESIKYGTTETYSQIVLTFKGIGLLGKKIFNPDTPEQREEAISQVSGPIGIVDFISNSVEAGFKFILIIGAIISINLGVFNLLPIPALDGGRFVFITLNGLIHKTFGFKFISEKSENIIHLLFFILLIALSLIIGYNDVIKIISR